MKYRKKPIVIEAFKWTGGPDQTEDPVWIVDALIKPEYDRPGSATFHKKDGQIEMLINVSGPEGTVIIKTAQPGDYIIKDAQGDIYPCKPDIFEATYEAVE